MSILMDLSSPAHQEAEQTPKGRKSVNTRGGSYWLLGNKSCQMNLIAFFDQITKLVVKQQMQSVLGRGR